MFALIDGNSFYCSCERAFDPSLRGKPVIVLSNNDGCAIARTHEAKDLGIKMGAPWHLIRDKPELRGVIAKSSNYALYADMSRRVYEVLCDLVETVEPYSIDEMFLDFTGVVDREALGAVLRHAVLRSAKIPTCVGIGPTKTIAKLANRVAKSDRNGSGVCDLAHVGRRREVYAALPVAEVWGIGPAAARKLSDVGARSIADFVVMDDDAIRGLMTVTGLRTAWELRGIPCVSLATQPAPKKSLAVTRSFGRAVTSQLELEGAIATYAARAAERLRFNGLVAGAMQVFVQTNSFAPRDPQYANSLSFGIEASNDTFLIVAAALRAARSLWRDGYRYAKAGIVLVDLSAKSDMPVSMLPSRDPEKSARLMAALDHVNERYGRLTLRPGSVDQRPAWGMRRANLSPAYTTRLSDVLIAKA